MKILVSTLFVFSFVCNLIDADEGVVKFEGKDGAYSAQAEISNGILVVSVFYPDDRPGQKSEAPPIKEGTVEIYILGDGLPSQIRKRDKDGTPFSGFLTWTSMGYQRQSHIKIPLNGAAIPGNPSDVLLLFNDNNCIRLVSKRGAIQK